MTERPQDAELDLEMLHIAEVITAIRHAQRRGSLDLFMEPLTDNVCGVRIADGRSRIVHMATIFSQSVKISDDDLSSSEIKLSDNDLTPKNVVNVSLKYLAKHFPETLNQKINFYKSHKDFKSKSTFAYTKQAA